jgi:hypothetical protein
MSMTLGFGAGLSHPRICTTDMPSPSAAPDVCHSSGVAVFWDGYANLFKVTYLDGEGQLAKTTIDGQVGGFRWLVEPEKLGFEGVGNTQTITAGEWVSVTAFEPSFAVSVRETDVAGDEIDTGTLPYSRTFVREDNATGIWAVLSVANGSHSERLEFRLARQGTPQPEFFFGGRDNLSFQWVASSKRFDLFEDTGDVDEMGEPALEQWRFYSTGQDTVRWHRDPELQGVPGVGALVTIVGGVWSAIGGNPTRSYILNRGVSSIPVTLPHDIEVTEDDLVFGIALDSVLSNGSMTETARLTILEPDDEAARRPTIQINAIGGVDGAISNVAGGTGPGDPFTFSVSGLGAPYDGDHSIPWSRDNIVTLVPATASPFGSMIRTEAPLVATYGLQPPTTKVERIAGSTILKSDLALPYLYRPAPGDEIAGRYLRITTSNGTLSVVQNVTLVAQASAGALGLVSQDDPNTYLASGLVAGPVHLLEGQGPGTDAEYVSIIPSDTPNDIGWYLSPRVTGSQAVGSTRIVEDGKAYNLHDTARATLSSEVRRGGVLIASDITFPFAYTVQPGDETAGVTLTRRISNGVKTASEVVHLVARIGQAPIVESASTDIDIVRDPYGDGYDYQCLHFRTGGSHLFQASRGGLIHRCLIVGGGSSGSFQWNSNRGFAQSGNGGEVLEFANQLLVTEGLNSLYVGMGGAGTVAPLDPSIDNSINPDPGQDTVAFGAVARGATATTSGNGNLQGVMWDGNPVGSNLASGGGAGAGGHGGNAPAQFNSGDAGAGIVSDIKGEEQVFGAGANGASDDTRNDRTMGAVQANAGTSANNGTPPTAGVDGFGSGGGATANMSSFLGVEGMGAAKGGDGCVILMIRIDQ